MNFNRYFIITIILIFCFVFASTLAFADDHSEEEVLKQIKKVEKMLTSAKDEGALFYASKEISKIEEFIKNSKTQLEEGEEDFAYYEIKKAKAYFKLVNAKKELIDAENDLKFFKAMK